MTSGKVVNVAASVRQRLLNLARQGDLTFDQLLVYYSIERFLYRLSLTTWASRLIVKGATLLRVWDVPFARPTRDIDFLGRVPGSPEDVVGIVRECLAADALDDGLAFDEAIAAEDTRVDGEYPGVRVTITGSLSGARFRLQLDIGIGDEAVPDPGWIDYPALLDDMPAPRILAYDPATSIAEKVEAMVVLGEVNSRLKDFYDVWLLATSLDFEGSSVVNALEATFSRRETPIPEGVPVALTDGFADDALTRERWAAFLRKSGIDASLEFASVVEVVRGFVLPPTLGRGRWPAVHRDMERGRTVG